MRHSGLVSLANEVETLNNQVQHWRSRWQILSQEAGRILAAIADCRKSLLESGEPQCADLVRQLERIREHLLVAPSAPPASVAPGSNLLSPRQKQVLKLIASGKSTKVIADVLGISFKTAVYHRTNIMKKLNVHETAGLVWYAIRAGLVYMNDKTDTIR